MKIPVNTYISRIQIIICVCQTFALKYQRPVLTKTLNYVVNISHFAEYINYTVKSKIKDPALKQQQKGTKSLCAHLHTWLVTRSIDQSASSVVRSVFSGVRRADALCLPINPSVLCCTLKQRERGGEAEQQGVQSERTNSVPGPIITSQHHNLGSSF